LFSFSISLGKRLSKELSYSLFLRYYWPELTLGPELKLPKDKPCGKKDSPSAAAWDRLHRHASA
jgi:hypothetical protein